MWIGVWLTSACDRGDQTTGLPGRQESLGASGDQFKQFPGAGGEGVGAGVAEAVAAVGEQPERDQFRIDGDPSQVRGVQGRQCDRVSVDGVGFAAVSGGVAL
ncbi:hypothetical protein [Nocardia transvalensis]|uniref:hypothetical protein n=1 Tax=Nocardia transvalensis TaxID=37333 RepID=UPI001895429E|nr:hypothetical protein [Nocardia transvalensis]MBF6332208.1 hypothetical protein [Nocardia transvalensis]